MKNYDEMIENKVDFKNAEEIRTRYQLFKQQNPGLRIRNIADELNISEAQILSAMVGENVTRMSDDFEAILSAIVDFGEVMALTRNEDCVHERHGVYDNSEFSSHGKMRTGLFVNPDIDLRLFMNHWKFCFAVSDPAGAFTRKSLQFFDKEGNAIHKIFLTPKSNEEKYDELVEKFKASKQENIIEVEKYDAPKPDLSDDEIDWKGFRNAWENLQDTHDFYGMLRKFKVGRVQALKNIGQDFAYKVPNDSSRKMLELASKRGCEIMVFVGNRGCIQIHTGKVNKLLEKDEWFNVLDPKFNLHLNEDKIASSWVVKKPTEDGIVTALEVFDEKGNIIVTFFGKRKPGIPELELWREIISEIKKEEK